jgi:nucleoside 2-deoxyribosyltransferase
MALKCFIPMAFDRKDTDRLYDKAIKPILKQKGISQFRVDRSNRNDDIDDQILSELHKCDFVIADLTYARPSVYFEAGIAQGRPVPVIYTCRRDHFKDQSDDKYGNLRVHFDLQMKPIIRWTDNLSTSFSQNLEKRDNYVIRPLVQQE